MTKAQTVKVLGVEKFLVALSAPIGWKKEIYEHSDGWNGKGVKYPAVRFQPMIGDIEINIVIRAPKETRFSIGDGHVYFDTAKGRMSFDRIGVDDSFYIDAEDTPASVALIFKEQLNRIEECRARLARSLTVPGLGYNLTPERLAEYQVVLKAGHSIRLAPSGFGIGHILSTRRGRYSHPAGAAINDFFKVGPLHIEAFDHD